MKTLREWLRDLTAPRPWPTSLAPEPTIPEPTPPDGVCVLDGHWWEFTGRDDYSDHPPEYRQYAPDVYRCQKCDRTSKVYANPPKVWEIRNIETGAVVTSGEANTHRHVAVICDGVSPNPRRKT